MAKLPTADLEHILTHTHSCWDELRGKRLFITGGTGFFGCWLLESFIWANDRLGLNASALVLSRNPEAFRQKAPGIAGHPAIRMCPGDVASFEFPDGSFSHIIHAATESNDKLNAGEPLAMFDTIVLGARHTLEFALACGAAKFLFTSSGAVYGRQPSELSLMPEDYVGAPDPMNPGSAYGEGKRAAELLCRLYAARHGFEAKIARCFAFVGPYLPLDKHFAIGNFIRDALNGGPIRVHGDGTPCRSYLYAADLAIWLWTILFKGAPNRAYNVGSEAACNIAELARSVAQLLSPPSAVEVARTPVPNQPIERYVPSTRRASTELGLGQTFDLRESIARTLTWYSRENRDTTGFRGENGSVPIFPQER
jgi:dTDP-glucose 4,6-dehydratase